VSSKELGGRREEKEDEIATPLTGLAMTGRIRYNNWGLSPNRNNS